MNDVNNNSDSLWNIIKTKDDLFLLRDGLEAVQGGLFKTKNILELLEKSFPYQQKQVLLAIIAANGITVENKALFQQWLIMLQEELKKTDIVSLTFAQNPKLDIIQNILQWCTKALNRRVILDIQVNPQILGGIIITYGGKYKDYSLRKQLESI